MLIKLRDQEILELKQHWLSGAVEAAVCVVVRGREEIHAPSLWSEVGTGVEGSSLIPHNPGTRLGESGEYPLFFMCKAEYTIVRQEQVWFSLANVFA